MKFENAAKGVKNIFIGTILSCISTTIAILFLGMHNEGQQPGLIVTLIILASVIAMAVGYVFVIRGLIQASKDEILFRVSVGLMAVSFLVALGNSIFDLSNIHSVGEVFVESVGTILDASATMMMCIAISRIFEKEKNEEMAKKGVTVGVLYIIGYSLIGSLEIISKSELGLLDISGTAGALIIVGAVALEFIIYVKCLIYLKNSKNELEKYADDSAQEG